MFHLFYDVYDNRYFIIHFVKGGYFWSGWITTDFSVPFSSYKPEKAHLQSLREFMDNYSIENDGSCKKLGSFRSLVALQRYVINHPELLI